MLRSCVNTPTFSLLLVDACPPQVLGLSKDCSDREVTRAYRKQVRVPLLPHKKKNCQCAMYYRMDANGVCAAVQQYVVIP